MIKIKLRPFIKTATDIKMIKIELRPFIKTATDAVRKIDGRTVVIIIAVAGSTYLVYRAGKWTITKIKNRKDKNRKDKNQDKNQDKN